MVYRKRGMLADVPVLNVSDNLIQTLYELNDMDSLIGRRYKVFSYFWPPVLIIILLYVVRLHGLVNPVKKIVNRDLIWLPLIAIIRSIKGFLIKGTIDWLLNFLLYHFDKSL